MSRKLLATCNNIIQYNNSHDVKIEDNYIDDLEQYDIEVLNMVKLLIPYGTDEKNNNNTIIEYIRDNCKHLAFSRSNKIYNEIVRE